MGIWALGFGWVGSEGAHTTPADMPLASTQSCGRLASRRRGTQCVVRRGAGGPCQVPRPLGRRRAFRWPCRGTSQTHVDLEFKPWDPRGKSRHPSSAADSQSSGLCWDDQPRTVPSPEARGHSQPPVKPPLKDTVSRALQTGQKSAASPHDLNGSFVAQMTDKCNN